MKAKGLLNLCLTAVTVLTMALSANAESTVVNLERLSGVTVTASSEQNGYKAKNVIDGSDETEWKSKRQSGVNQWIQIDLGAEKQVTQVVLETPTGFFHQEGTGANFKVYASRDEEFNVVDVLHTQVEDLIGKKTIDVADGKTYRYIKLQQTKATKLMNLVGIEILGYDETPTVEERESLIINQALGKTVDCNQVMGYYSGCGPEKLVDGNEGSIAAMNGRKTTSAVVSEEELQYLIIDLGDVYEISNIEIVARTSAYNDQDLPGTELVASTEKVNVEQMEKIGEVESPGAGGTFKFTPNGVLRCRYIGMRRSSDIIMCAAEMRVFTEFKESFGEWKMKKTGEIEYKDGEITEDGNYTIILEAVNYNTIAEKNYTMVICKYNADGKLIGITFDELVHAAGSSYPLYTSMTIEAECKGITAMLIDNTENLQMKTNPAMITVNIPETGE